jgi:hypothetical protein
VRALLDHRVMRENAVQAALRRAPATTAGLVDAIYVGIAPALRGAAERNVLAHLLKLESEGKAVREAEVWQAASGGKGAVAPLIP